MTARLRFWLSCSTLLFATAACSGEDSAQAPGASGTSGTSGSSGGGGTSNAAAPCDDVISISEIETILGVTGLGAPRITDVGVLFHCQYPQGTIPAMVQIRYDLATNRADFDEIRTSFDDNGFPTTDVAGLGETAYTSTTADIVTVGAFSGGKSLIVNAPASLERVTALCTELFTRI
jgi:hypothetical protein